MIRKSWKADPTTKFDVDEVILANRIISLDCVNGEIVVDGPAISQMVQEGIFNSYPNKDGDLEQRSPSAIHIEVVRLKHAMYGCVFAGDKQIYDIDLIGTKELNVINHRRRILCCAGFPNVGYDLTGKNITVRRGERLTHPRAYNNGDPDNVQASHNQKSVFNMKKQATQFEQNLVFVQNMDFMFVRMMVDHYIAMKNTPGTDNPISAIKDVTLTRYLAGDEEYFSEHNWFRDFITWFYCE